MGRLLFSFCPNCSSFPAESVKSQDHRVIIRVNYWITVKLPKYNHITAIILYCPIWVGWQYDRTWIGEPKKNTLVFIFEPDLIFYDIFRIIFNRVLCTSRGFSHIIWVTVMFLLHRRVFWVRNLWMMIFVPSVWCIIRSLWWGSHWKKIVVGLIWVNYFYWPSRPWPTTFWARGKMVEMPIYTLIKHLNAVSTGFIADSQDEI